MGYVVVGFGLGVAAAIAAFFGGAGFAMIALAYVGGGSAVLLAALVSAMMFDEGQSTVEQDPMLLPHR
ncbi:hypothetical protein [uncultured Boseongicola sp.]|jgi:hypothetical protein|uniref:hypothetical protein n=1 Tax=uncultured Boseongicola sp. TaxID=1648499 RepID=UPI002604A85B|nr:hypothetical protein [uncultured Boseongicola sp.]